MRRVRLYTNREKVCDSCGHTDADLVTFSGKEVTAPTLPDED